MPAALSNDIRKRIVEAREKGDSVGKISREKNVSTSAINKLMALYRETGKYEPRPLNNGRKPRLNDEHLEQIRDKVAEQPDIALKELIEELSLPVCESALCRTLNRKLGLVRKKNRSRCGAGA